jgi:serpin B
MKRMFPVILVLVVLLNLGACLRQSATVEYAASGKILKSDKQRVTSPDVSESDLATLVEGNSTFAIDLYQALRKTGGNVIYSPYSISLALAMTYAGARGETERQMADTLHFILAQDRLHSAFDSLDIELGQRGKGAAGKDEEGFRLNVVNNIWGQEDYQFLSEFIDLLAENYGADLRILDFINAPEESRITINDWVSEQTEGRIEDLIPQGLISTLTRLVITNAIYFNAAWQHQFEEDRTDDGPFYLLNGNNVSIPMMKQTESFGYAEGDVYQAVELPYDGGEVSMVILLPRAGKFEEFEGSLDVQQAEAIVKPLEPRRVALAMPRFKIESSYSLREMLTVMGMPAAFSTSADFSGITKGGNLFISDVLHKAFITVDEKGTEAAAATAVIMRPGMAPQTPVEVTINRPFIFFIRDIKTGTILFAGRITNPGM